MTSTSDTKRIGYFCSYVPKEIIYAFGKLPVRVFPTAERASEAEAFLPRNFCSLVKVILAGFLEGDTHLDAVVHADACDGLRRLHDVWREYIEVDTIHLLDLPRIDTALGHEYFRHALSRLVTNLEQRFGQQLKPQDLRISLQCYNEQRSLLSQLDRMWSHGAIPSSQYYELRRSALTDDPLLVNKRLKAEVRQRTSERKATPGKPRVMLVGSLLTHQQLVEAIESNGARLVAEDSCSIGREVTTQIPVSDHLDEMLGCIASAYLGKPPCPRMRDFPIRFEYLSRLITERRVEGVVSSYYKFCDLFMSEYPVLRKAMQDRDLPVLLLEDEGEAALSGQHRTRLEAFLELLR